MKKNLIFKRAAALLLAVLCVVGLVPANSASAADDTIKLLEFGYSGVAYQSDKLGRCAMHQMYFDHDGETVTGFCADHGAGMGFSLVGQTWGDPVPVTDPTVKVFVAFFYSNVERVYTDKAKSMGLEANWSSYTTWYMNAIVQAIIWRYKEGTLTNPVEDCAEEMMYVYNSILGEHYTSIDQEYEGVSFRDFIQSVLDEGIEVWGDWNVYEYTHTGPGSSYQPAGTVQGIIIATPPTEATQEHYSLIIKKVDAADPDKGLLGAHFNVQSENGSFMRDVFTGADGTCTLENLNPGTYAITEVDAPAGYTIDDPGPQYAVLPNGDNNTVTVTFTDSKDPDDPPPDPANGSIRKVDADNPTMGLAGSVIKVEGMDNDFVGTYTTDEDGYLSEMPWDNLENGSYTATEVTPPEGYTLSSDPDKVKQTFEWDGEHDVALVFENDAKVKVQLKKQDESGRPLAGVVFNIFRDGQLIGSEATDAEGAITVAAVTEGLYSFVEVAPAEGCNKLTWPVFAYVDQADIQGGGTVTVTAVNNALPGLRIVKIDSKTGEGIPGVTFRIWRDTTLIDDFITGPDGEIVLDNLQPGTYVAQEVSSDDSHVLDGTPQQVELVAGEGVKQLVFVNDPKPGMRLVKLDNETMKPLAGAKFRISRIGGDFSKEYTTDASGQIDLSNLDPGSYEVVEVSAPNGYLIDNARRVIELVAGENAEFVFTDTKRPTLVVEKRDAKTGESLAGATFRIAPMDDPDHYVDKVTDAQGRITLEGLDAGVYSVQELNAPEGYVLNGTEHHVKLYPGETSTIIVENEKRPALRIVKYDAQTKKPLPDTTFEVYRDSELVGTYTTDANGEILLYDLTPGTYFVKEVSAPDSHVLNSTPQEIELEAGQTGTLVFLNYLKPGIYLVKLDSQTMEPLANAKFRITQVGGDFSQEYTTDANGEIDLSGLDPGTYTVEELAAPDGYLIDDAQRIIKIEGGEYAQFVFTDTKKPSFKLVKLDSLTGERLPGATFRIAKVEDGTHYLDRITDINGEIVIDDLEPGIYSVLEMTAPEGYVKNGLEYHVELVPGRQAQLVVSNAQKPNLVVIKRDADTGEPVPGTVFLVEAADGHSVDEIKTGEDGKAVLENLLPGVYNISEKSVPAPWLKDAADQLVTLYPNRNHTVYFENHKKPGVTVNKIDSMTGDPLKGAKFHVVYASNNTFTGEINDLGDYYTDENGQFKLYALRDGWYRVTELEPPAGYAIKDPATQDFYLKGGESKEITFENTPLSAIVIYKYDTETGKALEGAVFQIKYLSGTSGTGGTVIGTYKTSANGTVTVTGLRAGTYVIEEIASDSGHVIDTAPQTVYLSGESQAVVQVYFGNVPKGGILIKKIDAVTHEPLSDVQFFVTDGTGAVIGTGNGYFTTDSAGSVLIEGLDPGSTVIVKETRAKDGYILDDTPQTAVVKPGKVVTLEFRNQPKGSLIIVKKDSVTGEPLKGVTFTVTTSDGRFVGNDGGKVTSNGLYYTDENGQIIITGLETDTYVVTETATIPGYVLDAMPQTVVVNSDDTQTLAFYNTPTGGLVIYKVDAETGERIPGVKLEVRRMNGEILGEYTTDKNGVVQLPDLTSGWYTVTELSAASGYILDATPRNVEVKDGQTATLELVNSRMSNILIRKVDAETGKGLYGAVFLLYDGSHNPIKQLVSDQSGYVYMDDGLTDGRYYIREIEAPEGYILDNELKTIYIQYGSTTEIVWKNTAVRAQIQIVKKSADDNPTNGLPAGTLLEGAVFEIYDKAGNVVDTVKTDRNGRASSKLLPLGRYTVREVAAPANYSINPAVMNAYLEHEGQIVTFEVLDESVGTGVSIEKTGPKETMAGQPVRYVFSNIANNSTVSLSSFYWRDTLPAEVRLDKIVTGTYNRPGTYKIVYKVNNESAYRTLADSLSTSKNYTLAASATALGLGANERVTEIMFVFGHAPAGFAQVEAPMLYCTAISTLTAGSSFVNVADVGGIYNDRWIQAVTRWVTTVYGKPTTLPRTGY